MLTITAFARQAGLSRTAVLYYESIGLLPKAARTAGNYRSYGEPHLERLRQIKAYRNAGLKLEDIRALLGQPAGAGATGVLERRLGELSREIERLQDHQRAIVRLLGHRDSLRRRRDMTKDKWVAIMRATGFTDEDMQRWHREFEREAPADHQEFLEYLKIPGAEIERIRAWSQGTAAKSPGEAAK